MSCVEHLSRVSPPFVTLVQPDEQVATEALGWQDSALLVRAVRGRKTRTVSGFFDELAAALQFPYYFGENWNAFNDCMTDLDWLPFEPGIVIVVYGAGEVLADADPAELNTLVRQVTSICREWAEPVEHGEAWDRPSVPFHVALQGEGPEDFVRWARAGAELQPLEGLE